MNPQTKFWYLNGYPFNAGKKLVIALIIGVVAGVIVAFVLKKQLKSVRQQKQANVYTKSGSIQITASRDAMGQLWMVPKD